MSCCKILDTILLLRLGQCLPIHCLPIPLVTVCPSLSPFLGYCLPMFVILFPIPISGHYLPIHCLLTPLATIWPFLSLSLPGPLFAHSLLAHFHGHYLPILVPILVSAHYPSAIAYLFIACSFPWPLFTYSCFSPFLGYSLPIHCLLIPLAPISSSCSCSFLDHILCIHCSLISLSTNWPILASAHFWATPIHCMLIPLATICPFLFLFIPRPQLAQSLSAHFPAH